MLCPKLMLLEVILISKLMPADFVWSRVDKAADPLLFLTSQLCLSTLYLLQFNLGLCREGTAISCCSFPLLRLQGVQRLAQETLVSSLWKRNINQRVGQRTWSVFLYLPPNPTCFL